MQELKNEVKKNSEPRLSGGIQVLHPPFVSLIDCFQKAGDKNSTRPPVITSEILKGQVILPKAGQVLWEELLEEVILHITPLCSLKHAFKGQVHVFAGRVKIVSHSSCRTSTILKFFCSLQGVMLTNFLYFQR